MYGIDVTVGVTPAGSLMLDFSLEGELSGLCIPESRPSRRSDRLWQHTCFEAFLMAGEGPGYREFNFSPSGEWAAYAFGSYRDGGALEVAQPPGISVDRNGARLVLGAEIHPDSLPAGRTLRLGLSAVVEDAAGVRSYWALRHPPGQPDFHHPDAFVLHLELPTMPGIHTAAGGGGL